MRLTRRLSELFPGHRYRDRVARRAASMPQQDLVEWADQGLTQVARALRQGTAAQDLEEATDGTVVIAVVLEELARRVR